VKIRKGSPETFKQPPRKDALPVKLSSGNLVHFVIVFFICLLGLVNNGAGRSLMGVLDFSSAGLRLR
jgi:hypothetical protein